MSPAGRRDLGPGGGLELGLGLGLGLGWSGSCIVRPNASLAWSYGAYYVFLSSSSAVYEAIKCIIRTLGHKEKAMDRVTD